MNYIVLSTDFDDFFSSDIVVYKKGHYAILLSSPLKFPVKEI